MGCPKLPAATWHSTQNTEPLISRYRLLSSPFSLLSASQGPPVRMCMFQACLNKPNIAPTLLIPAPLHGTSQSNLSVNRAVRTFEVSKGISFTRTWWLNTPTLSEPFEISQVFPPVRPLLALTIFISSSSFLPNSFTYRWYLLNSWLYAKVWNTEAFRTSSTPQIP